MIILQSGPQDGPFSPYGHPWRKLHPVLLRRRRQQHEQQPRMPGPVGGRATIPPAEAFSGAGQPPQPAWRAAPDFQPEHTARPSHAAGCGSAAATELGGAVPFGLCLNHRTGDWIKISIKKKKHKINVRFSVVPHSLSRLFRSRSRLRRRWRSNTSPTACQELRGIPGHGLRCRQQRRPLREPTAPPQLPLPVKVQEGAGSIGSIPLF